MKIYTGTVLSAKMSKTITVEVSRRWSHPLYQKTVKRTKKYLVHDEQSQGKVGDRVSFKDSKPFSKKKRFQLVKILAHHTAVEAEFEKITEADPTQI